MRYFNDLPEETQKRLFWKRPEAYSKRTERDVLRRAVGALLYVPATNPKIAELILQKRFRGASTVGICLEDAVGEENRDFCISNTARQLEQLAQAREEGALSEENTPLLFVRVKNLDMLRELSGLFIRNSDLLTGVILPKVRRADLGPSLSLVAEINRESAAPFYAMPILESEELIGLDRLCLLEQLKQSIDQYEGHILNIRIGATDLSGLYGIRRTKDTPIYSIGVTSSCITDIVRVFGLKDRYTISGPVWEYFKTEEQMRETGSWEELSGLLQETALDLQNGLLGKTCIHPSQLLPVQASYPVPFESYQDAMSILSVDRSEKGVVSSIGKNKMNELKPHALWAEKIVKRAQIYGVYQKDITRRDLLSALYCEE